MKVRDYYNKNAQKYAENSRVVHPEILDVFLSRIKKGKILDLGCGTGQDSEYFASKGYEVLGVDISEGMLEIARSLSDLEFVLQDMTDLHFENDSFVGVWASSSLFTHVDADKRKLVLHRISRILKPKGGFGGTFKPKDKEFPFNSFSKQEVREELSQFEALSFLDFSEHGKNWCSFFSFGVKPRN